MRPQDVTASDNIVHRHLGFPDPVLRKKINLRDFKLPQRFQMISRTLTALEENVHDTLLVVRPLLPTHCRCRGLLLHLIIFDTHAHTHSVGLPWRADQTDEETST